MIIMCADNEVIFDADFWVRQLPQTVHGIYVYKDAPEHDQAIARKVHGDFLHQYSSTVTEDDAPLLWYNQSSRAPFELMPP